MAQTPAAPLGPDDNKDKIPFGEIVTNVKIAGSLYPIKLKHTPARLARDIVTHNDQTKFTGIAVSGLPGTGKSTLVDCLTHAIHKKDSSYAIHRYKKEQIKDINKIVSALPKRQNCILIFDDISYVFEQLPEKERAQIMHDLTIIREKLDPQFKKTKCIVFLIFHYSYALDKPMRQSNFRIMTSITDDERDNYLKVLGYQNKWLVMDYIFKYLCMFRYKKFWIPSPNEGEPDFTYHVDKPFRVGLVSNMGEVHYTLYHEVKCGICQGSSTGAKAGPKKADAGAVPALLKSYGPNRVKYVTDVYNQVKYRKKSLPRWFGAIWNHLEAEDMTGLDTMQLGKIFADAKKAADEPVKMERIGPLGSEAVKERYKSVLQKRNEYIAAELEKMANVSQEEKAEIESQTIAVPEEKFEGQDETDIEIAEPEPTKEEQKEQEDNDDPESLSDGDLEDDSGLDELEDDI